MLSAVAALRKLESRTRNKMSTAIFMQMWENAREKETEIKME